MTKKIYFLYAPAFLSAFLLFQIELIIAKIFLPKFGGSYLVWGSCLVFFQFVLLGGYWYSHVAIKKIGMYRYGILHSVMLLLPLFFFPGRPLPEIIAHSGISLVFDVFFQLLRTIGPVFFVLSTISVVTQSWLAHSRLPEQSNPYMLYAVSNIGSFLGLLSYPFVFEFYFDLDVQLKIWRMLYFILLLSYLIALMAIRVEDRSASGYRFFDKSRFLRNYSFSDEFVRRRAYWFLLSAAGCIVFLAVTNIITYEITPCPLLWIIPLCIYLASFALTFRDRPLYPRWITDRFHLVIGLSVALFFFTLGKILPISPLLVAFTVSLFALCMFCQHELYLSRPEDKVELTAFYLWISFGGLAGSVFVTWIAPRLFTTPIEFLAGIFLIGLSICIKQGSGRPTFSDWRLIAYIAFFLMAWPLLFKKYNVFGVTLLLVCFWFIFKELSTRASSLCALLVAVLIITPFCESNWNREGKPIGVYRNYYGIYRVTLRWPILVLMNGTTLHGAQYVSDDRKKTNEPILYYHRNTAAGKVLGSGRFAAGRIGVVGMGIGTLSAYGKEGQVIDFYELDPDLSFLVKPFDYLENSRAKLTFTYDDARIALNRAPRGIYDILIIDAFSGDSVPFHLLTTDAIGEYRQRIKDRGVILFHISNRYLDLAPVLFSNARVAGAHALHHVNEAESPELVSSKWVALTWDREINNELVSLLGQPTPLSSTAGVRPWTDRYSHVLSVLRPDAFLSSLKSFTPFSW